MIKKLAITIGILLIVPISYAVQTGLSGVNQLEFQPYEKEFDIEAAAVSQGVTAPTAITLENTRCLGFDADAEIVFMDVEIAEEWDGVSDWKLEAHWYAQSGSVIGAGETVIFDIDYRSIAPGEPITNGTVATATATYTQSGAGTDEETFETEITIPATGGNQPLAVNDLLLVKFNRDVSSDTYGGDAVICFWEFVYTANKLGTH